MTRVPDSFLEAMLEMLRSRIAVPRVAGKLLVLVDGALLRNMPSRSQRRWQIGAAKSLLPSGAADGAVAVGPLLFELTVDQLDRSLVESLIDLATGEMVGSFLVGADAAADVAKTLGQFVDVRLDDGTEMVMRFYDPRILPFWLDGLPQAYRAHLGIAIAHWFYWGPDFGSRVIDFTPVSPRSPPPPAATFPVRLSLEQEAQLMDSSTPHLLMSRLRSEDPGCLSKIAHADRYSFIRQQIDRATAHGLSGPNDVEAYCGLAVTLGSQFDADPTMKKALREVKAGMAFDEALTLLGANDWKRIREAVR